MFELHNDLHLRTLTIRVSGLLREDEARSCVALYQRCTDEHRGARHLVLADLRGMAAMSPEAALLLAEAIRYGREHGVICCVHLSDSSVARLQARRLARELDPNDSVTVNAVSLEEAERVLTEQRAKLKKSS